MLGNFVKSSILLGLALTVAFTSADEQVHSNFECPENLNEIQYFSDPEVCSVYYICGKGVSKVQRCPEGLHFNSESNVCDFPANANCHAEEVTRDPSILGVSIIRPDPDFECPGNGAFPDPTACELFYTCWEGDAVLNTCTEVQLFDLRYDGCNLAEYTDCGDRPRPEGYPGTVTPPDGTTTRGSTTTRDPDQPTTTGEPDPGYNCTSNGVFPHPVYCEKYYSCYEGEDILFTCSDCMLYDLTYDGCNFPELTACQDRIRPSCAPGTITPPPGTTTRGSTTTRDPDQPTTTGEPDPGYNCTSNGVFPHPVYCEKYYSCYEGEDILFTCSDCMLYDLTYDGCNFPELTACQDRIRPSCAPGTITPPPGTGPTTTRRPGAFECPVEEGIFPDPEDCASFYQCSGWIDFHNTCPRPLLYNPSPVDACDHPVNVDCGDRPRP